MEKIRVGIVGCGKVAHMHAKALRAIPECELAAVYNHHVERARGFAEEYGIKAYGDLEEMIRDADIAAVSICTPHPNHADPAVLCAERGVHIAVEKPLAVTLADCDRIITAAERNGVVSSMVCQRRFYEPVMRMREAIDSGKIGKPVLGSVNVLGWRDMDYYRSDPWRGTWDGEGGGVLVNQAVHQLDLFLACMGEIDSLYGMWDTLNHPELEVDDTAIAVIRFKNGALGTIAVSNSQNPGLFGNVRVHGSNGASVGVQTDGGSMFIAGMSSIAEAPYNDIWTVPGEEEMLPRFKEEDAAKFNSVDPTVHYHTLQLKDFILACAGKKDPAVTLEDGRRAVELFTAIYRSERDHKLIRFPLSPDVRDLHWK